MISNQSVYLCVGFATYVAWVPQLQVVLLIVEPQSRLATENHLTSLYRTPHFDLFAGVSVNAMILKKITENY